MYLLYLYMLHTGLLTTLFLLLQINVHYYFLVLSSTFEKKKRKQETGGNRRLQETVTPPSPLPLLHECTLVCEVVVGRLVRPCVSSLQMTS